MEFRNAFTVGATLDTVWGLMLDPEQVAPCVPGAQITEVVDDQHFRGTVKVKLGPVQISYRGEMELHQSEPDHTIVLRAKGTETRGSGGATGTVTIRLADEAGSTRVDIHSQVDVTGRAAQFGRGIMQDVADRLIQQFAGCLESKMAEPQEVEPTAREEPSMATSAAQAEPAAAVAQASSAAASTAAPAPSQTSLRSAPQASELRVAELLYDASRRRLASWLRSLASRVEPR